MEQVSRSGQHTADNNFDKVKRQTGSGFRLVRSGRVSQGQTDQSALTLL